MTLFHSSKFQKTKLQFPINSQTHTAASINIIIKREAIPNSSHESGIIWYRPQLWLQVLSVGQICLNETEYNANFHNFHLFVLLQLVRFFMRLHVSNHIRIPIEIDALQSFFFRSCLDWLKSNTSSLKLSTKPLNSYKLSSHDFSSFFQQMQ